MRSRSRMEKGLKEQFGWMRPERTCSRTEGHLILREDSLYSSVSRSNPQRALWGPSILFLALIALTRGRLQARDPLDRPVLLEISLKDLMKVEIDSVSGLAKYKQRFTAASGATPIIPADEIQRYGYRTLA